MPGPARLPRADDVAGEPDLLRAGAERIGIERQHNARIGKARQATAARPNASDAPARTASSSTGS